MIVIFGKGEVGKGLERLLSFRTIDFVLMDDNDRDDVILDQADTIIVSPGIKPNHNVQKIYGHKCVSELNFLGKELKQYDWRHHFTTIGITGTNGKSTTTRGLYQVLQGMKKKRKTGKNMFQVYATGNFKPSLSWTLAEILEQGTETQSHVLVIECSSFMLYKLEYFIFDYGVLLNIAVDHLDWHTDFAEYEQAKRNILTYSKQQFQPGPINQTVKQWVQGNFVGEHNYSNLSVVYDIAKSIVEERILNGEVDSVAISFDCMVEKIFSTIKPLEHRCQDLGVINGIRVIDDGICTSSLALESALKGMHNKVILICGGFDKGDDFTHLDELFLANVAVAICMGTIMAPKFVKQFDRLNITAVHTQDMKETVGQAFDMAKKTDTDTILFSPGCSSFDIFKNVYDRIKQFGEELEKVK